MEGYSFYSQVLLELGGKSPNVIFESADLEQGGSLALDTAGIRTFLS